MRINVALTKGLSDSDKDAVVGQATYAKDYNKALSKEIRARIEASYVDEEALVTSDIGAHMSLLGYRRGLREALLLIPVEIA